ncbi:MAG TPA: hypothetical protein DHW82_06880 [Spirochaetia bacterium]|nr:MAG: hypothetical protein A2Y41_05370 [Spirochaetes bacterium GWB1_36_13]HCL56719.1 hypothetical protein [Spirochaetia bacterium]
MNEDYLVPYWQLETAKKVQSRFLPQSISPWNGLQFAYEYHSLDPIGGDYLDFFDIVGNKKGLLIADVSGHGIPAAIITAMAKMSFSNHAGISDSPREILQRVNEDIFKLLGDSGLYLTAVFLVIDQDLKIHYASAGHPPLIYYHNETNSFENLKTQGLFIGAFEDAWETFQEKEIILKPGDKLILYTDGIVEARNPNGEQYGTKRLEETVAFSSCLSSDKMAKMIINDVHTFRNQHPLNDDMSLLVIETRLDYTKFQEHYQKGLEMIQRKKPEWVQEFKEAFEYNQDNYSVNFYLGRFYFKKKQFDKAKNCFEHLIKNKLADTNVLFYMARILMEEKKYLKSIGLFKEILKENENFKEALSNLGYCYYAIGKIDKAKECYQSLLRKYPKNSYYKGVSHFFEPEKKQNPPD